VFAQLFAKIEAIVIMASDLLSCQELDADERTSWTIYLLAHGKRVSF